MNCPHNDCNRSFGTEKGLQTHWGQSHNKIPPWKVRTCDFCGKEFGRPESHVRGKRLFCSDGCQSKWQIGRSLDTKRDMQLLTCDECGVEFREYESKRSGSSVYCTRECYRAGEPEVRNYGENWKEQRKLALEEKGKVCHFLGCEKRTCDDGRELHIHHLTPMLEYETPEESNELSNLIPVCAKHHPILERADDQEKLIE